MNNFCKNCGTAVEAGAKFCGKCGAPVDGPAMTQSASKVESIKNKENINFKPGAVTKRNWLVRFFSVRINRVNYINAILWPIVVLVLILSLWGLVHILTATFGTANQIAVSGQDSFGARISYLFDVMIDLLIAILVLLFYPWTIALSIRRIHDIGKSGWFSLLLLVPYVNFIYVICLFCIKGQETANKYGMPPILKFSSREIFNPMGRSVQNNADSSSLAQNQNIVRTVFIVVACVIVALVVISMVLLYFPAIWQS